MMRHVIVAFSPSLLGVLGESNSDGVKCSTPNIVFPHFFNEIFIKILGAIFRQLCMLKARARSVC